MADSPIHPRYWPTWFVLALLRICSCLPFPLQQAIGWAIGWVTSRTLRWRRHIVETNIGLCFPELSARQQETLVRANLIATGRGVIETAFAWWGSDSAIRAHSRIDGLELLQAAREKGCGVLLIGAHYTTLELAGRVIGLATEIDITYRPQRDKVFDECMRRARQRSFRQLIEKQDMRAMIRSLRQGRVVWYAPDQDFGRAGSVFAPFFHRPAATLTTVGKLLEITQAQPLFYSLFRTHENGRILYHARIHDPFADGFNTDDLHNATRLNRAISDIIRQHPEQYLWTHERFRTQPAPGMEKPYRRRCKKKSVGKSTSHTEPTA